jgi:hypothetical protein
VVLLIEARMISVATELCTICMSEELSIVCTYFQPVNI